MNLCKDVRNESGVCTFLLLLLLYIGLIDVYCMILYGGVCVFVSERGVMNYDKHYILLMPPYTNTHIILIYSFALRIIAIKNFISFVWEQHNCNALIHRILILIFFFFVFLYYCFVHIFFSYSALFLFIFN